MTSVGTHGQICLDGSDYSAIALAMQHNRDVVDAALTADQAALNSYNNRPWLSAITTTFTSGAQSLGEWTPGTSFPGFGVLGTVAASITSSGMPASLNGHFTTGWWLIGGYVAYAPTGAVTNFTRRTVAIQVFHTESGIGVYDTIVNTSFESNTGTDSMNLQGLFYLDSTQSYQVTSIFAHRNAGSTIQVNTGARLWMAYLGTGVEV